MQKWVTKREYVQAEMRRAIISGEFEPGRMLSLEELAESYGVSLTPIREALRELEADGLVVSEPHKGTRVRDHSVEDAYQVFTIRAELETLVARLAMLNFEDEDLTAFHEYLDRMEAGFTEGDLTAVRDANRDFHYHLYKMTGWPQLESLMRTLWAKSPWSMLRLISGRTEHSIQEHIAILDALKAKDNEKVAELLRQHVISARNELVKDAGPPRTLGESVEILTQEG